MNPGHPSVRAGLRFSFIPLLALSLLAADAAHAGTPLRRFALLIGTNDGGPTRVRLRYAATDARAMAKVLTSLGGVQPTDLLVVEEPDVAALRKAFATMDGWLDRAKAAGGQGARTEVVVYYSGHSDEKGLLPAGQLLKYDELRALVRQLDADVRIAVLDSCASGALIRTKGGKRRPAFLVDESNQVKGQAILTSSSADELAQESDGLGGSFFTHHLVTGLRGAADTSGDGRVTLSEVYQYAFHETLRRTEGTRAGAQHANYAIDMSGTGDVVITDLAGSGARLRLERGVNGRVLIRKAGTTQLVAEISKAAGRTVEVGLEPGPYDLTIPSGVRTLSARVDVSATGVTKVRKTAFTTRVAEVNRVRGGEAGVKAKEKVPEPGSDGGLHVGVEVWASDTAPINVGVRLGSGAFRGLIAAGYDPVHDRRVHLGGALGGRIDLGSVYLDIEGAGFVVVDTRDHFDANNLIIGKLRVSASFPVANVLEIFVGASFNSAITLDGERRGVSLFGFEAGGDGGGGGGGGGRGGDGGGGPDLDVWPGLFAGARF